VSDRRHLVSRNHIWRSEPGIGATVTLAATGLELAEVKAVAELGPSTESRKVLQAISAKMIVKPQSGSCVGTGDLAETSWLRSGHVLTRNHAP